MRGTIIKGIGGYYYVDVDGVVYECRARGVFRNDNIRPLVGDVVEILVVDDEMHLGNVQSIFPRRNVFIRPPVANVDNIVIVVSETIPKADLLLLDKLLVIYQMDGIKPLICVNKIDEMDKDVCMIQKIYQASGYGVVMTSAKENVGIDELKCLIKDSTTIFTGQSGVGKSSIINRIIREDVFDVGMLSKKIFRGKNTTRHVELVEMDVGGFIVDSPGFSSVKIDSLDSSELQYYYPEFGGHIRNCRFTGCSHVKEVGCEVKKALEDGRIDEGRYNRYIEIYTDLSDHKKY